jgi:hypothetical protein
MREIIVTIKPSLSDISNPVRISEAIRRVGDLISNNMDFMLGAVGEEILKRAKTNATVGYRGLPHSGKQTVMWPARDELTRRLYAASPYHDPDNPGLSTGADKLINSLDRLGDDNIFEMGNRSVEVGSRFRHADILEHGGVRHLWPNIGFRDDGSPTRWLREAFSNEEIAEIRAIFNTSRYIEPRPFLRPALWDVRDTEEHTRISAERLVQEMRYDVENEITEVRSGDVLIVNE